LGDFTSSSKGLQTVTKKLTQKLRISTHVCVGYVKAKQTNKQKSPAETKPDICKECKNNATLLASISGILLYKDDAIDPYRLVALYGC